MHLKTLEEKQFSSVGKIGIVNFSLNTFLGIYINLYPLSA